MVGNTLPVFSSHKPRLLRVKPYSGSILKNLNLALAQGVLSGIRSASVSLDDAVEVVLEENQDLESTTRAISALPGFTIELVYNSTLFLNREDRRCEQLPLENILEIFIEHRIKYLTTRHRCSRREAVNLYSAELAEIKSKFSKPRLTKILYR